MDGNILHKQRTFASRRNLEIFHEYWLPKNPRASIFIVHGLGEHSGRWHHVALFFAKKQYAVFIHDHEGHGHTPTPKKIKEYFDRMNALLNDSVDHIRHMHETLPDIKELPCFLLGHSMGGAMAIRMAMMQPDLFHGVVISAPAMGMLPGSNKFLYLTSNILASLLPTVGVASLDLKSLCSDPAVVKAYEEDPLVWHGKVKMRVGSELLQLSVKNLNEASKFALPYILLQGMKDKIVDPNQTLAWHQTTKSEDKTLLKYENMLHEIFNEPEKEKVMEEVSMWMDQRLAKEGTERKSQTTNNTNLNSQNERDPTKGNENKT